MTVLGLTGSIGMGKTTTADMFRDHGVPVWDADAAVARLYGPGGEAAEQLARLAPDLLDADGAVDRAGLRRKIARDPGLLALIERVVHPLVAEDRAAFLADRTGLAVLDVPLLFETGLADDVDRIAVVSVDAATQRARVLDRGTMTEAQFEMILSRQMPDADKRARADYIIDTTDIPTARAAVDAIVRELA